jgi:hypothetical protein
MNTPSTLAKNCPLFRWLVIVASAIPFSGSITPKVSAV